MLEIRNLSCGYDLKIVLQEINLKIKEGEVVGIIGPNGSGKTTLLRAITKIIRSIKGEILFQGKDIERIGYRQLAKEVAVVSQSPLANFMSVEEFVLLGRIPYYGRFQFLETKRDLEIAARCMKLTDIFRLKDRLVQELSGGERQLALIARALTQEPKLLLLDEPTAHLDITHQAGILDLIRRLNKKIGLTVIMVLHDLNLASEYCQRLVLINQGRIYKTGWPQEVLTYQIIEEVYKTVIVVERNSLSSKPYILMVSEEERMKKAERQGCSFSSQGSGWG
ncbi:ABC transporter ATP-binding protein [candidate division NPL-UPA2 bacterium]|nr:ABC transporter ATP-binding protein [candidate division NPL-UPA2 bacterium]